MNIIYYDTYRGDPRGIETMVIKGLDTPREFYSPNYESPMEDVPAYDNRATLYWNPEVTTDENGEATVEFFTSDSQSDMLVNINGMEPLSGNTGEGKTEIPVNYRPADSASAIR